MESGPGNVTSVEALMLWVFVDVDPARMSASDYNESVARWEATFLNFTEAANGNASVPLQVFRNANDSVEKEIYAGVSGDMVPLYMGIITILVRGTIKPRNIVHNKAPANGCSGSPQML